jgi:hypothetical protein
VQGIIRVRHPIPTITLQLLICYSDTISNELYQDTNVALLCEDIVNGMIAANEFRGTGSPDLSLPISSKSQNGQRPLGIHHPPLEVTVDIEKRDWDFKIQAGRSLGNSLRSFG